METIAQIRNKERAEVECRKSAIYTLIKKLSKHRGWKKAFLDENAMFNNDTGLTMITNAHAGCVSDKHFLLALELFYESVETNQPEWYTKVIKNQLLTVA